MKIKEFGGDTSIFDTIEEEKIGEYYYQIVFDFDARVVQDEFMVGPDHNGNPVYQLMDTLAVSKVYIYKVLRCHEEEGEMKPIFEMPDDQYRNLEQWLMSYIETHSDNYINEFYEIH